MNRLLRGVFIGCVLAVVVASSAISLPNSKEERGYREAPAKDVAFTAPSRTPQLPANQQPSLDGPGAYLAQIYWKPFGVEVPSGFWTTLAGACLILPFGLTAWATTRKRA